MNVDSLENIFVRNFFRYGYKKTVNRLYKVSKSN